MTGRPLIVLLLLGIAAGACSRSPARGEQEELPARPEDVPAAVQVTAARIGERVGGARCEAWFWDTEDRCWECRFVGLSRQAELDVEVDGRFSELELVYEFAEVEQVLPEVADLIRTKCRDEAGVFIELSLRRESHLENIPEFEGAWGLSGVVLEFQCPGGRDFEFDARGLGITTSVDDTTDSAIGASAPD